MNKLITLTIAISILITACNSSFDNTKKKGYFAIYFPEKKYQLFDDPTFPYSFEYPIYAKIVKDTSTFFDNNPENIYWRNIDFTQYNAKIFLSYKAIGGSAMYKIKMPNGTYKDSVGKNDFDKMISDAFRLTNKNEEKALGKKDSTFTTGTNISGMLFKLKGDVATQRQFFITDTTKNFIRGALYFYASPNADSLQPVVNYLQQDIDHMINTFKWKR